MLRDDAKEETERDIRRRKGGKAFKGAQGCRCTSSSTSPPLQKISRFKFLTAWLPCFQMSSEHNQCNDHFQHHLPAVQAAPLRDKQQQRFEKEQLESKLVKQVQESLPWEDQLVADINFLYFSGYIKPKIY